MTLNTTIYQLFQQIQNPALTTFSKFVALTTDINILLPLSLTISLILYFNRQKSYAILLSSTSIFTAATIKLLKFLIQAPRPISTLIQETSYSFPSGHTTFAVIFFGLITYVFTKPKHRTPAIITSTILIIIIASSRLYLQVHWLTDIIGGLIIGTTILTLGILIHKKYFNLSISYIPTKSKHLTQTQALMFAKHPTILPNISSTHK